MNSEYPVSLLAYGAALVEDGPIASMIVCDEYAMASYFAVMIQSMTTNEGVIRVEQLTRIIEQSARDVYQNLESPDDLSKQEEQKLIQLVDSLRAQFREALSSSYAKDFMMGLALAKAVARAKSSPADNLRNIVRALMKDATRRQVGTTTPVAQNFDRLRKYVKLNNLHENMIEASLLISSDVRFSIFLRLVVQAAKSPMINERLYKALVAKGEVELDDPKLEEVFAPSSLPIALSIVRFDQRSNKLEGLSEYWSMTLASQADTDDKFFERFFTKLTERKKTFSGAIARAGAERDHELFGRFLKASVAAAGDGNNALIYGGRKLDKLGYVQQLLEVEGLTAAQLNTKPAKAIDVPSICYVVQRYLARTREVDVLIVNRAEEALTRNHTRASWMAEYFGDDDDDDKRPDELTSDELLINNNPIPTVWMTNAIGSISPENVGRFLLHLELKGGSRKDRRTQIEAVIKQLGLSPELTQKLSMYLELNIEQVKSAAQMATLLGIELTGEQRAKAEELIEHLVDNSQRALERDKTEELRSTVTKYSLSLLNLAGEFSPEDIISSLKRSGHGTVCLYGLPGTGKTAFVEYLAMQLDKPLVMKSASDIFSKWLGDNEKNIAAAFDEARQEDAILFLDEADSFLRDRNLSEHSWETSQVNELIQRMERFKGIFICATNLFRNLDAAALRRFTFKLEFRELSMEQRHTMFENEVEVKLAELPEAEREEYQTSLAMLRYLTPGDFAAVKRQLIITDRKISPKAWLSRLEVEIKSKMASLGRSGYAIEGGQIAGGGAS